MKPIIRGIRILAILCLLCSPAVLFSQDVLIVSGIVKDDATRKKVQGVTIIVLQNGSQFDAVTTGGGGRYEFELPLGFQYDIRYTKDGFVGKSLRMDTRNIPEEDQYGGFQMNAEMSLFSAVEGFDTALTDEPVGIAAFDQQKNSIEWDFAYTANRQQLIKDELDRLENLEANMAKMKARFDELIEKGDGKMGVEKYEDALNNYEDALSIFPDDELAIQKRDEAQAKIDEMNALADLEARYEELIAKADSEFKGQSWESAKTNYQEALNLKSSEKWPKEQIQKCDEAIALAGDQTQFDALVAEADGLFKDKDYALSIDKYKEARDIFPDEKYPPKQIKEAQRLLDELLADAAKLEELQKRYDDLMKLGLKNFKAEDYELALNNFEDASAIFPEEVEPRDKIDEINKILSDLAAMNEANAAEAEADAERERIEKEYQALITSADQKFDDEKLEDAKVDYQAALDLKANEKYPKSRIKRIDDLLARAGEDLLAEQERQAEEDARLAAEEESKLAAEERERLAEEERERRMEEERQERVRQAEEERRREEEERQRRERMLSNIDRSREDEVDSYFREAKRKEDLAKSQRIDDIKDREQSLYAMKSDLSADFRSDREDQRDQKVENLSNLQREGVYLQEDKSRQSKQEKEKTQGFTSLQEEESRTARNRAEMGIRDKQAAQENYLDKSEYRQSRLLVENREQENYVEYNSQYRERGNALRQGNEYDVSKEKEGSESVQSTGSKRQQLRAPDSNKAKERVERYQQDVRSAADERRTSLSEDTSYQKEKAESLGSDKENLTVEAQANIQRQKSRQDDFIADRSLDARRRTYDRYKELHDKDTGTPPSDDELLEPDDAGDLPEGVSEKSYELGNKIVIERTVKSGNKVDRYKKVVSKSGTYYFKNDASITEQSWKEETLDIRD